MANLDFANKAAAFRRLLDEARSVTIVTHVNPDADTIATALGLYRILKTHTRLPVEVVNVSKNLPHYLDFLPGFDKIKTKSDFDGLVVACDGADISRFGIDISGRSVVNIDHHTSNTHFGTLNVVSNFASAGETAYMLIKEIFPLDAQSAQCFYTALFSDTRGFTTDAVNQATFRRAGELIEQGADPTLSAFHLTQRKSLASVRLLQRALASLRLYRDATVAVMMLYTEDFEATGAKMSDLDGIVDHAKSLATVDIGVLVSEVEPRKVRVSLRSKYTDVNRILSPLGGGGHTHAAGVVVENGNPQQILDTILREISGTEKRK